MMTANCKRVLSKDNEAIGGVIHVVEDILHPVTGSLIDIISSNPALSYMKTGDTLDLISIVFITISIVNQLLTTLSA